MTAVKVRGEIVIHGAREHNLRSVDVALPKGRLICFTGLSGSGKSSLAFDTLFAEGQRRYLESLSSYARQFMGQLPKPDVDQILGLCPAICIQQKARGWNPRSTVGTITQIHDYLRVLFARVGRQHCPCCGKPIEVQSREQIVQRILEVASDRTVQILAPTIRGQKGEFRDYFATLRRQGYARVRVDGKTIELSEAAPLERHKKHDIALVMDRLTATLEGKARLAEAVESALVAGEGELIVDRSIGDGWSDSDRSDIFLSSRFACGPCGVNLEALSPQMFSFNSPIGMCRRCDGLGEVFDFDPDLLTPDPSKSVEQMAIAPMKFHMRVTRSRRKTYRAVAAYVGFDLKTPWQDLSQEARDALLYGLGEKTLRFEFRRRGRGVMRFDGQFGGILAELRERHRQSQSAFFRAYYEKYMRSGLCPDCHGARLRPGALAVRIGGVNLHEYCSASIREAMEIMASWRFSATEEKIARDALREVGGRLQFLCDVGLDYLSLHRSAPTLSGGESQRIRLASQIGSGLVGVLYVLDEPSIGLHPRDQAKLLQSLRHLRDMGNTVIVVEHDEQTMRAADLIVDFGPGAGSRGGEIVAMGTAESIAAQPRSITGRYLSGVEQIDVPTIRRPVSPPPGARRSKKTGPHNPRFDHKDMV